MIGRQMMLFLAIYLLVVLLVGIPAAAGWLVYFFILGNPWAGYAVAWVLLVGTVCGLVPLLALAFRNFDVARDTPP
jgi:membrane protein YdbS with pleckstrin-like domain